MTWWTKGARGYFTGSVKRSSRVSLKKVSRAVGIKTSFDSTKALRGYKVKGPKEGAAWARLVQKGDEERFKSYLAWKKGKRGR